MPKGELSPLRNVARVSATPSPSASRSKVMRLALGTPDPAFFWNSLKKNPLIPRPSLGRTGPLVSATRTSPLGNNVIQRGWSRPVAKAATRRPGAAIGVAPAGQPTAGEILSTGIGASSGGGRIGAGPMPCATFSFAGPPQAASDIAPATQIRN